MTIYKKLYADSSKPEKLEMAKRIIEYDLVRELGEKGSKFTESAKWMKQAAEDELDISFDHQGAKILWEAAKKIHKIRKNAGSQEQAIKMAKSMVKRKVNFPAEASITVLTDKLLDDGTWVITGTITAKNAFGVKSEYVWGIVLKREREGESYEWKELDSEFREDK